MAEENGRDRQIMKKNMKKPEKIYLNNKYTEK